MKKIVLFILVLAALSLAIAPVVLAAEGDEAAATAQASGANWKAIAAALAVGLSALASGWAQAKIGSAAAGALAEKPEISGIMVVLEAIPETMIILGFVVALLIMIMT